MMFKYLIFFLLLGLVLLGISKSLSAQSQTLQRLEITQISAPEQGVAVFRDYPDNAAIIIVSPLTNLQFSSNIGGIVREMHEPERGRYVLILEPYTQILVIEAHGFMQQRQRIGNPEAREVRYFEVKPETSTGDLISVIFNVTPAEAQLFVDGQDTEMNQAIQLAPGSVEVRLEREGYRTIEDAVEISEQNIQFNYQLEEIDIVPVRIASNVEGGRVVIDGTERGEIDRSGVLGLFLYPGSYALSVSISGYVTNTTSLEVNEEGENSFTINLQRNIGELALDITPSDAQVELNRQFYTGQQLLELAPGRYRLDVQKEGYAPYTETIEIERNERQDRSITLEAYTGSLQFLVSPGNASVLLLDDSGAVVEWWQGINLLRNLKVGRYTLQVEAPEHLPVEESVDISRDKRLEHNVLLVEGKPWKRDTETEVVNVTNPATGRTWMDRNLGALRAATSSTDEQAYGDLYQWGRAADGHQKRNSPITSTLSNSDQPGHGSFITSSRGANWDWRSPQNNNLWQGVNGINNPCPSGYRLPTENEWKDERNSWSGHNEAGAISSLLKLPLTGNRVHSNGRLFNVARYGFYRTESVDGNRARFYVSIVAMLR